MSGVPLLAVLGALVAFGPISTDLYLPALPQVDESLGTSAAGVQLTLTASMTGLAMGIDDRTGRGGTVHRTAL